MTAQKEPQDCNSMAELRREIDAIQHDRPVIPTWTDGSIAGYAQT